MNNELYWLHQCARTLSQAQESAAKLSRAQDDIDPALDAVRIRLAILRSEVELLLDGPTHDGMRQVNPNRTKTWSQTPWCSTDSED